MKIQNIAQVSLFALMLGVAGSLSSLSPVMADDTTVDDKAAKPEAAKVDTAKVDTAKVDTAKVDTVKSDTVKSDTVKSDTVKSDTVKSDNKVNASKVSDNKVNASKIDVSKGTGAKSDTSDQSTVLGKDGAGEFKGPVATYRQTGSSKDGTEKTFGDGFHSAKIKYNKKSNSTVVTADDSDFIRKFFAVVRKEDLPKATVTTTIANNAPGHIVKDLKSYASKQGLKTQTQPGGSIVIKAKGEKAKKLVAYVASAGNKTLAIGTATAVDNGNKTLIATAVDNGNKTLTATAIDNGNKTLIATNSGNRATNSGTITTTVNSGISGSGNTVGNGDAGGSVVMIGSGDTNEHNTYITNTYIAYVVQIPSGYTYHPSNTSPWTYSSSGY